jgi:hypothetical protein
VDEAFIDKDLDAIITTFTVQDRDDVDITFSEVEPLASYSWKETGEAPTILVPGTPHTRTQNIAQFFNHS